MTDVDTVLFDLDDTLLTYERSSGEVLALAFEHAGVDPFFTESDYFRVYEDVLDESDGIADLRERAFALLAREHDRDPEHGSAVARAFNEERDQSRVVVYDGAHDTLDSLRNEHSLGLVTNGDPGMQGTKLRASGLDDYFDTIVHGGSDTPAKPEPDGFHRALDALDASPDRAVHVGNSLTTDVPGAHAAGLRSVWLAMDDVDISNPDPRPHYTVRSLHEVRERPWLE